MHRTLFFSLLLALSLATSSATALSIPFVASINEAQVVPPTGSPAFGTGVLTLDDVTHVLDFAFVVTSILFEGPESISQIHGPAAVGANGPAIADLPDGSLKFGSLDLTLLAACSGAPALAQCESDLKAGLWYILVSTDEPGFPTGEVRGQILPVVPEPSSLALGVVGLTGLLLFARRPDA